MAKTCFRWSLGWRGRKKETYFSTTNLTSAKSPYLTIYWSTFSTFSCSIIRMTTTLESNTNNNQQRNIPFLWDGRKFVRSWILCSICSQVFVLVSQYPLNNHLVHASLLQLNSNLAPQFIAHLYSTQLSTNTTQLHSTLHPNTKFVVVRNITQQLI